MIWKVTGDCCQFTIPVVGGIKKITTCGTDTESCMAKIGTLDFALLLILIAFTIIYIYEKVIFNKIVFHIIVKGKLSMLRCI